MEGCQSCRSALRVKDIVTDNSPCSPEYSHNRYLFDHCRCEKCFHAATKQRLKQLSDVSNLILLDKPAIQRLLRHCFPPGPFRCSCRDCHAVPVRSDNSLSVSRYRSSVDPGLYPRFFPQGPPRTRTRPTSLGRSCILHPTTRHWNHLRSRKSTYP